MEGVVVGVVLVEVLVGLVVVDEEGGRADDWLSVAGEQAPTSRATRAKSHTEVRRFMLNRK